MNMASIPPVKGANAPLLYSIDDARALLGGVGRTWLFEQISTGRVRSIKLGRRTMIPVAEIEALVANGVAQ